LLTTRAGECDEARFDRPLSEGSHHPEWFERLFSDFLGEIRGPGQRGTNFREAGWCVALTRAAYESSRQGFREIAVAFPGPVGPRLADALDVLALARQAPEKQQPQTAPSNLAHSTDQSDA